MEYPDLLKTFQAGKLPFQRIFVGPRIWAGSGREGGRGPKLRKEAYTTDFRGKREFLTGSEKVTKRNYPY